MWCTRALCGWHAPLCPTSILLPTPPVPPPRLGLWRRPARRRRAQRGRHVRRGGRPGLGRWLRNGHAIHQRVPRVHGREEAQVLRGLSAVCRGESTVMRSRREECSVTVSSACGGAAAHGRGRSQVEGWAAGIGTPWAWLAGDRPTRLCGLPRRQTAARRRSAARRALSSCLSFSPIAGPTFSSRRSTCSSGSARCKSRHRRRQRTAAAAAEAERDVPAASCAARLPVCT